jgi:hypothetical protein
MIIMMPLLAFKFCSPSPLASSWRRGAAPETSARTRFRLTAPGKIYAQLSRLASSPHAEASHPGASARNRYRPALDVAFKSP